MSKSVTLQADVFEFDLDGTLVNTTLVVEKLWSELADKYGIDKETLFRNSHGVRTAETYARFFPMVDNTNNKAVNEFERSIPDTHGDLVKLIPGTIELLNKLDPKRWCIVTSGSHYIAHSWFKSILKTVKKPEIFITAEMVTVGKPDPQGYLKGDELLSEKLGLVGKPHNKIVFEDAPAGIKAGLASGATVIGISSGFDAEVLYEAGANYVVKDLTQVKLVDEVTLEVNYD